MNSKQILGKLNKDLADLYKLDKHVSKPIVLYPNDKRHCEKRHLTDFPVKEQFYYVLSHLESIIKKPDFIYYNDNNKSLEYYKKLGHDITVRVKIEEGKELKVKTFFPVDAAKMEEKRAKANYQSAYLKYVKQ